MKTLYCVCYRTGGTENATWHRTINYATKEEAVQSALDNEEMGYKSLVFKAHDLDVIGLPQGYNYSPKAGY